MNFFVKYQRISLGFLNINRNKYKIRNILRITALVVKGFNKVHQGSGINPQLVLIGFRSSRPKAFCKKCVLKSFAKFTAKKLAPESLI